MRASVEREDFPYQRADVGIVESFDQLNAGRFATARRTYQCHLLTYGEGRTRARFRKEHKECKTALPGSTLSLKLRSTSDSGLVG